ncbi:carbamoyltransferase HypF [Mobiluncus mulieris 28-1]|uniref:carbamoyltransferase HypF n=1 Tax=Mobiluncus mulieris TaxID=2052 RepID=UPI00019F8CA8|nr:carbamoyltransferase HypF [Mobiluncus mulieris]EEJ53224.1 carbamoyltransferase HypF [Mobiluncus mulieris ATCC 35243]EEZ92411.1 carbamoyltransferase HypF [Mobiluncus mulieris 28-1]MCU9975729.1 carbamoyltransferase HypF [Mobiluncus mulieris]MCV0002350.1 carbamoyltransferase HypF [Mobiluncus mulieris]SPX70496.1 Carbamoyltransferase hypF [Mobiluncus mulieris]
MDNTVVRRRWILTGIVQGVGFRPHVARVASRFGAGLTGFCGNDSLSVFIEAQGELSVLRAFIAAVVDEAPPLSYVMRCQETTIDVVDSENEFRIVASRGGVGARTLIPPDVSLCAACLADIRDPGNRRYGYAFTTCTNCGPRLSIIEDLPYDRPQTTMRDFPLCAACAAEYRDPGDRRFHAQPISCYDCGPHLWLVAASELPTGLADPFSSQDLGVDLVDGSRGGRSPAEQDAVLDAAAADLRSGKIVAVKGLGGFHLLVDATNETAVSRLRRRKHRDGKPLAVMVADFAAARALVDIDTPENPIAQLLLSPAHPIVLAVRHGAAIAPSVAPGLDNLGVMLAYTPLHLLLLERVGRPVVATSGNLSSEPLCYTNADALRRLGSIADTFLLHNRGIAVPVEDSVIMAAPLTLPSSLSLKTAFLPVRRSRGYVPLPFPLPEKPSRDPASQPCISVNQVNPVILGVGGELKNTFTLVRDGLAFTSAHLGDMGSLASQLAYEKAIGQLTKIHREHPTIVIRDLHPNYATTAWAERYVASARDSGRTLRLLALQHHRAHALSLLAETRVPRAIVIAVDGTGYGDDAKIWGSEVFLVDTSRVAAQGEAGVPRLAHLPYFPLPGADLAVREPWRQAVALLRSLGLSATGLPLESRWCSSLGQTVLSQVDSGSSPWSCALGRYFDAVAALLGLCEISSHEAAAPVAVQTAARRWQAENPLAAAQIVHSYLFQLGSALSDGPVVAQWTASPPPQTGVSCEAAASQSGIGTVPPAARELPMAGIITELVAGIKAGICPGELAFRFHVVVAKLFATTTCALAAEYECAAAGITGGSALNSLLTELIGAAVKEHGLTWLTHQRIPANDGGLSLGQAFYGWLVTM